MAAVLSYLTPTLLLPIALVAALLCFFGRYWQIVRGPGSVHEHILR